MYPRRRTCFTFPFLCGVGSRREGMPSAGHVSQPHAAPAPCPSSGCRVSRPDPATLSFPLLLTACSLPMKTPPGSGPPRWSLQTPLHSMTLELLSCMTSAQPALPEDQTGHCPSVACEWPVVQSTVPNSVHVAPVTSKPARATKK